MLKEGGYTEIHVPNIRSVLDAMLRGNLDINDTWYRTGQGHPITFHDVLFGWGEQVSRGNEYYAHKTGFTARSLSEALLAAGFSEVMIGEHGYDIYAKATKQCLSPT